MIARMERVEIVFLRSEMRDMIPFLQEQGVLHLEDVPLAMENAPGFLHRVHLDEASLVEKESLDDIAGVMKEIFPLLPKVPTPPQIATAGPALVGESRKEWMERARVWHKELRQVVRNRAELQDEADVLRHYQEVVEALSPVLLERNVRLGETARALVLEGYSDEALEALEKKIIAEVGPQCGLATHAMGRKTLAVVTFPEGKGEIVGEALVKMGIAPVSPPDGDVKGSSISEVSHKIAQKVAGIELDIENITHDIAQFTEKNAPTIHALQQLLDNRLKQLSAVDHFAQSRMVGVVNGWVPSDDYDGLRSALKTKFGDRVELAKLSLKDINIHHIPTKLSNPKIFQPFEMILQLFSPATYGSFDPTKLVAISFILFYGFILGDAGYGLFIIAVAWWARNKFGYNPFVSNAMTIAMWMGVSSVVFGIWFWEFFGTFGEYLIPFPGAPFFHRAHETSLLLYMAIGVGIIHIPLALLLGVREGLRHGHVDHALEKLAMLLGVSSVGLVVMGQVWIAAFVFVVAVVLFIKSMGAMFAMGVIEIIGITANILSYARLMALGVASIALADIANDMPNMMGPVIGIPMALLVHLLNIGIGVFSPTIHSLRLNYVEFLPKFYETEGKNYQPFRKEMAW